MSKLKRLIAYFSLGLLFSGWAFFSWIFVKTQLLKTAQPANTNASNLEQQRLSAIEEAKKQGKKEYTFTTDKLPIPLSP